VSRGKSGFSGVALINMSKSSEPNGGVKPAILQCLAVVAEGSEPQEYMSGDGLEDRPRFDVVDY
jgi:hypothetical protein